MQLILPRLERVLFKNTGSKNIIRQLISEERNISVEVIQSTRSGLILSSGDASLYLTGNKNENLDNKEFVLLTNGRPTSEKLSIGEVKIKRWLKHPDLKDYSVDQVRNSWQENFFFLEENELAKKKGLRQPQIGALHMIMGHLKLPLETATIVLPTGTGKTETMLSALVANRMDRLLVIVPSDSLRTQISDKFYTLGLLKNFGIVGIDALYPIIGVLYQGIASAPELKNFIESCNVVISTMAILTAMDKEMLDTLNSSFSNIFIDEAHHVKAKSWNEFKASFPPEKIIQYTATPYRNDGKRLDGKIIFNFPLREAQKQGYFKKIDFLPIREYDPDRADIAIAEKAIDRLKEDIAAGYDHILMARCETKDRAKKVYEIYKAYDEFSPVMIHSSMTGFEEVYDKIIKKQTKIIVCVDMLGEGFDLPELKIAAFHDIRKSLPITLQFAGRFTRTKHDEVLGDASFIANIADLDVKNELSDLYSRDADWNQLLSEISFGKVQNEVEFKELMSGFSKLSDASIPFQNIKVKLSTVVFKNKSNSWFPSNFYKGIKGYENLFFKFHDINSQENILVVITADQVEIPWVNHKDIYHVAWNITVVYWDSRNNLLFINSSDNSSLYEDLANAILDEGNAELIKGIDVFKAFYNIKRVRLQNVGLRYFLGKDIRFRMMVGSDVAEALSIAERQKGEKAFVMGSGFENGESINIGASYKGRIWEKLEDDLMSFKKWCNSLGSKLIDANIDPNQILQETLIPTKVTSVPSVYPVWIDWDIDVYLHSEIKVQFEIGSLLYDLSILDFCIHNPSLGGPLYFLVKSETTEAKFELQLFENVAGDERYPDFKIVQHTLGQVNVYIGTRKYTAIEFFEKFVPTIWFADGSALTGNDHVELKQSIGVYPSTEMVVWDWLGVNLSIESQGVNPVKTDSIQYKVIQELLKEDFDIIYDDDYSGEIADVIAMKLNPDKLKVNLYHLKYAIDGKVSNNIKNMYEVCGQAQKSIHWKHKGGADFINHLLRRKNKTEKGNLKSRIEKGSEKEIEKLLSIVKKEIPVEFEIFIVQPSLSKSSVSNEILTLLGVTENYIKEIAGISLKVITSS